MKKIVSFILIAIMSLSLTACSNNKNKKIEPQASQMKSICELASMKCYYHNVAKYMDDDATGQL